MQRIMIFGATSAIAQATARLYADEGAALFLVARNEEKLCITVEDLRARGACSVSYCVMDALDYERHAQLFTQAENEMGGVDILLVAHGSLPDQKACEQSFDLTHRELQINMISVISILTHAANYFEERNRGSIAVISSVAGDRGRQSNYVYGSSKGALTIFLQGLRNRLYKHNIQVLTIKPGFVDTPMTEMFNKNFMWVSPEVIAKVIHKAVHSKHEEIYVPWYWNIIMMGIKSIPNAIIKKLQL